MRRFEILEPKSIQEACGILAEKEDVKLIAGGTALLILIKQGIFLPKTLVNLKKIKGGSEITYSPADGLRVGGLASIYDIESTPVVRQHYPLLAQACHVVANIRIRNMATIGGNLEEARVVVGAVSPAPVVVADQDRVKGIKLTSELIGEIAQEAGELVDPIEDLRGTVDYKRQLVKVLVRRALTGCLAETAA